MISAVDDSFSDFAGLETNPKIEGKSVIEILEDIDDADVLAILDLNSRTIGKPLKNKAPLCFRLFHRYRVRAS